MLSDRPYMRQVGPGSGPGPLAWLLGGLVAMFVAQNIAEVWFSSRVLTEWLGLSRVGLAEGRVWTLVTYALLHQTGGFLHLLANGLGLFFLGRELLPELGARRFFGLYFGASLAGGLFWLAVNWGRPGVLMGSSGAVLGMLILFACLHPNRRISFLLFFVIPITVLPKYLALVVAGLDVFGFFFSELPGGRFNTSIAHSAHLGGMLAGLVAYRWFFVAHPATVAGAEIEPPRWLRRRKAQPDLGSTYRVNVTGRDELKAEVDRILDKINHSGFGSLSADEKQTLDRARDLLSRR